MDPLTHTVFAIACGCAVVRRKEDRRAAALAALAGGLLPDADVFLKSASDPLFNLEYHRHFTHSLAFAPVIGILAALIANALRALFRKPPARWGMLFGVGCLAALSHVFCDAWTSYGTRVFWPFSDVRVSLDWISIIDPILTVPLVAMIALCLRYASRRAAVAALCWTAAYLGFCNVQRARAWRVLNDHLAQAGITPDRAAVKPSFGNVIVWRGMFTKGDSFYPMAIRLPMFGANEVISGEECLLYRNPEAAAAILNVPLDSVQGNDIRRFFHFSDDWVGPHPENSLFLGDLRYAQLPNEARPLWGIQLDPTTPERHVQFQMLRKGALPAVKEIYRMIEGKPKESEEAP